MTAIEAMDEVNRILNENLTQEFDAQDERTAHTGKDSFIVSNSRGLAVMVVIHYDEDSDEKTYEIFEEWEGGTV